MAGAKHQEYFTFSFETVVEHVLFRICAFKLAAKIYEEVEKLNLAFLVEFILPHLTTQCFRTQKLTMNLQKCLKCQESWTDAS